MASPSPPEHRTPEASSFHAMMSDLSAASNRATDARRRRNLSIDTDAVAAAAPNASMLTDDWNTFLTPQQQQHTSHDVGNGWGDQSRIDSLLLSCESKTTPDSNATTASIPPHLCRERALLEWQQQNQRQRRHQSGNGQKRSPLSSIAPTFTSSNRRTTPRSVYGTPSNASHSSHCTVTSKPSHGSSSSQEAPIRQNPTSPHQSNPLPRVASLQSAARNVEVPLTASKTPPVASFNSRTRRPQRPTESTLVRHSTRSPRCAACRPDEAAARRRPTTTLDGPTPAHPTRIGRSSVAVPQSHTTPLLGAPCPRRVRSMPRLPLASTMASTTAPTWVPERRNPAPNNQNDSMDPSKPLTPSQVVSEVRLVHRRVENRTDVLDVSMCSPLTCHSSSDDITLPVSDSPGDKVPPRYMVPSPVAEPLMDSSSAISLLSGTRRVEPDDTQRVAHPDRSTTNGDNGQLDNGDNSTNQQPCVPPDLVPTECIVLAPSDETDGRVTSESGMDVTPAVPENHFQASSERESFETIHTESIDEELEQIALALNGSVSSSPTNNEPKDTVSPRKDYPLCSPAKNDTNIYRLKQDAQLDRGEESKDSEGVVDSTGELADKKTVQSDGFWNDVSSVEIYFTEDDGMTNLFDEEKKVNDEWDDATKEHSEEIATTVEAGPVAFVELLDFGSYEDDVIRAYTAVSARCDKVPRRKLSVEEECPNLLSAIQDIGNWCQEMQPLPISDVPCAAIKVDSDVALLASSTTAGMESDTSATCVQRTLKTPNGGDVILTDDSRAKVLAPVPNEAARDSLSPDGAVETVQPSTFILKTPEEGIDPAPLSTANTFDWKQELESPDVRKGQFRARPRDRRTGGVSESYSSYDVKTPEASVEPVGFDSCNTFDWKNELQSPAIVPRTKRRSSFVYDLIRHQAPSPVSCPRSETNENSAPLAKTMDLIPEETSPTEPAKLACSSTAKLNGILVNLNQSNIPGQPRTSDPNMAGEEASCDSLSDDDDRWSHIRSFDIGTVQVNGKTVLPTIPDSLVDASQFDATEYRRLLIENRGLKNRLQSTRFNFDDRVTPFRDIFEERRKLRMENARIAREKKVMEAEHLQIQKRIAAEYTVAVEKTRFLQAKLAESKRAFDEVKAALADAEEEISFLKSTR